MDSRGFPTSLPEFQEVFPDDAACAKYLESLRWPKGFVCGKCQHQGEPFRFKTRTSVVLRCRKCKYNTSLTAGTVMQSSHTPISTWFWGAYLASTQTPGQSALQFQRQLGLSRYETAFQILHKLRTGMVRPERDMIGGEHLVEIDECFIGCKHLGPRKEKRDEAVIIGAVEVRQRKPTEQRAARGRNSHEDGVPLKRMVYAGRIRLRLLPGRNRIDAQTFAEENVKPRSTIKTDGWKGYSSLGGGGFRHDPLTMYGQVELADVHLPMIHLVFSNLKTWLLGTHHGAIVKHHLQAYLNEYVFRFNRRFYPQTAFHSLLGVAAHTQAATYEELYSGNWKHPC